LHQRCADISKGYVQKGALLCVDCRLQAMGAEGQPAESLLNEVAQLAVIELTEGREATSSTHSAFVTLTEKWVAEKLQQGVRRIASPTENKESFKNFAKWMVLTADRERSFETTMRAAGGYFTRATKPDFTKEPEVKALISELKDKISTAPQPRTHGTRRMLTETFQYGAPAARVAVGVRAPPDGGAWGSSSTQPHCDHVRLQPRPAGLILTVR